MGQSHEITKILQEWCDGDNDALDELMPLVYSELRIQAARFLRHERPNHTLQPTALINETYLRLINQREVNWENRAHFFGIAASLMRRILIDYARAKHRDKRGGKAVRVTLDETVLVADQQKHVDLIALDEALCRLKEIDERQAKIVELRYFGGLTLEETAAALNFSRTIVAEDWAMARAWLHRELTR